MRRDYNTGPPEPLHGSRAGLKPIKILNIRIGNRGEEDEVSYISENDPPDQPSRAGRHLIIFCKDFLKKMNNNEIFYNTAPTYENVMNYVKSNISHFDIYTTDGEYINKAL
jgi:hypothetical protein